MNYLAHAYFSFGNPEILTGNMISDFVKGKKQYDYPISIQKGIKLHRAIDQFTDDHAATKSIKQIFAPLVRLYSGAFADIVYDHFLALDPNEKTAEEWMDFTEITYTQLGIHQEWFPSYFARIFPYMQQQNWLYNYRFEWGMENSFKGLQRRAAYLTNAEQAFELFLNNYAQIRQLSADFIPDVKIFAIGQFQQLVEE
ncbi:MAG: ACP phosphodiesterase [Sediminibacterium sp.]|jgi:acyl carrier protein phosphodiesterase